MSSMNIEFSAPVQYYVITKAEDKSQRYQSLLFELHRLYIQITLVVLIIGVLGWMKDSFASKLKSMPVCCKRAGRLASHMQAFVLLGFICLLRQFKTDCNSRSPFDRRSSFCRIISPGQPPEISEAPEILIRTPI